MEQEIEKKLELIYNGFIDVEFKDYGVYDVFLTLKGGQVISVVFMFNAKMTMAANMRSLQAKIDNELIKLFKKVYNV